MVKYKCGDYSVSRLSPNLILYLPSESNHVMSIVEKSAGSVPNSGWAFYLKNFSYIEKLLL